MIDHHPDAADPVSAVRPDELHWKRLWLKTFEDTDEFSSRQIVIRLIRQSDHQSAPGASGG